MNASTFLWSDWVAEKRFRECVHCGFCLPVCPTYRLTGREMDSPRGRIYVMDALATGKLAMVGKAPVHLDLCLGCRACESVCPSGVKYGQIIEAGRVAVLTQAKRTLMQKAIQKFMFEQLLPFPKRLKLLLLPLKIWNLLPAAFKKMVGLLTPPALRPFLRLTPSMNKAVRRAALPVEQAGAGKVKKVGMLSGCVASVFFDEVNQATRRILAKNHCQVFIPPEVDCCGAMFSHTGAIDKARETARKNIDAFMKEELEAVVVNAAGCGASMKEYGHLLQDDPQYRDKAKEFSSRVKDITEFLVSLPFEKPQKPLAHLVTYHEACHLCHAQGIRVQPRTILQSIPGVTLIELPDSDTCCGSAGTYNLVQPKMAKKILDQKLDAILATQAEFVAMGNPGCLLQIQKGLEERGSRVKAVHYMTLLDLAYFGGEL